MAGREMMGEGTDFVVDVYDGVVAGSGHFILSWSPAVWKGSWLVAGVLSVRSA
jgi:hypothetical protein